MMEKEGEKGRERGRQRETERVRGRETQLVRGETHRKNERNTEGRERTREVGGNLYMRRLKQSTGRKNKTRNV